MDFQTEEIAWPWRKPKTESAGVPHFCNVLIQFVIMAAVALWTAERWHRVILGAVVGITALLVLLAGLFTPKIYRQWESAWQRAGRWISTVFGWLLLAPFYYLFCLPVGLVSSLGSDRLQRRFEPQKNSYWSDHGASGQYDRQF